MIRQITLMSLLLVSPLSQADDLMAYRVASNVGLILDWAQTREIAVNDEYLETNPILGIRPTTKEVNTYFIGAIALNNLIGELLPGDAAKYWYASITIIQMGTVRRNYGLGIRMRF